MIQNRLLALNYVDEGIDDKLYEAHRYNYFFWFVYISLGSEKISHIPL